MMKENTIYNNNLKILKKGHRNYQPVALLERNLINKKEYIIAINYEIKNGKLEWGYGYYYENDMDKALQDFERVINGCNLENTFKEKGEEMYMGKINYNEINDELINKAEKMMNDIELYNMTVEFVLLDKNNIENSQVIVMYEDGAFGHVLAPYKEDFVDALEWDYSIDEHLFEKLENGMELLSMSDVTHLVAWCDIDKLYPEGIVHKKGMQNYLKYCKENGITKQYIEVSTNRNDFNDAMKHYKNERIKNKERER